MVGRDVKSNLSRLVGQFDLHLQIGSGKARAACRTAVKVHTSCQGGYSGVSAHVTDIQDHGHELRGFFECQPIAANEGACMAVERQCQLAGSEARPGMINGMLIEVVGGIKRIRGICRKSR